MNIENVEIPREVFERVIESLQRAKVVYNGSRDYPFGFGYCGGTISHVLDTLNIYNKFSQD